MKKNNVFTKIIDIVIDVIVGLVFVVSLGIIIANVSAGENGKPNLFGYSMYSVQTDSMEPDIKAGDLILGKVVKDDDVLVEGDIITFTMEVNGQTIQNTHEIIEIIDTGSQLEYFTQGTNTPDKDPGYRTRSSIIAKYADFRIPGLGAFIDFVKQPLGFVLCLILPMVAFIAYEIYRIVVTYMRNKKEEMLAEAKENTSDDVKDAIIKEYLEAQKAKEAASTEAAADPVKEEAAKEEAPAKSSKKVVTTKKTNK